MATQCQSSSTPPKAAAMTSSTTSVATKVDGSSNKALLQSPVPLSQEEAENDEVCKLAAKLAPVFQETDALFAVPAEFQRQNSIQMAVTDDDDNMDSELEAAEDIDLLRQELELAEDFSSLFGSLAAQEATSYDDRVSLSHEADVEEVQDDDADIQRRAGLPPIRIPTPPPGTNDSPRSQRSQGSVLLSSSPGTPQQAYTNHDHFVALKMHREERGGWYAADLTPLVLPSTQRTDIVGIKEYVLAIPENKLKHLFVGLSERNKITPTLSQPDLEPLPVRTIAVRIRPDVLCGAVMDAVHQALTKMQSRVRKRQGGHIRAVVGGAVVSAEPTLTELSSSPYNERSGFLSGSPVTPRKVASVTRYPAFLVDAQLCTDKTDECGRMLLIRMYHLSADDNDAVTEDLVTLQSPEPDVTGQSDEYLLVSHFSSLSERAMDTVVAQHLRECCALVQRIESPAIVKRKRLSPLRNDSFSSRQSTAKEMVSHQLLQSYRACPSAKEGNITLPGLNSDDWPVVLSSWRFVQNMWDELETRDLTYTTLTTSRFGAFPALPTLDVQYCSQIRRLSREAMIVQLLKSASELEEYAREAEFACANMIALLQPTFQAYCIEAPLLPKPVPLTSYPLDFQVPQTACPPWGMKVMEALNEVQALTSEAGKDGPALQVSVLQSIDSQKSLDMAKSAVELVHRSFQKQDDEEQSARLGRKNMQVMDRLAKMQAHQRASIQTLQNSTRLSDKAAKAADEFQANAGLREVPLLKWSIVVGGSTGTCWITANHLLFVTKLIPYIGGSKTALFQIEEVEFALLESPASLLNPLPTSIKIKKNGQEVYTFRPSMGGARLHSFLEVAKDVAGDAAPLDVQDATASDTIKL